MSLSVWRPGYGPWQATRWTAITLSLLAHGAAAAWVFSMPSRQAERRIEIPIEVTTVPFINEPLSAQQPAPPEIPPVRSETEIQATEPQQPAPSEIPPVGSGTEVPATEPQQPIEATPSAPAATTKSTPSAIAPDKGPAETVPAVPPAKELSTKESSPPTPAISQKTPPTAEKTKPVEAIKPPPAHPNAAARSSRPNAPSAEKSPAREVPKAEARRLGKERKAAPSPREQTAQSRARGKEKEASTRSQTRQQQPSRQAALPAKSDPRAQASYMAGVTARLLSRKYFPEGAPGGSVVVNFSVASSGKLLGHRVVRSSGSSVLDQAALHIVERAAPFPAFPSSLTASHLNFNVPMSFNR